MYKRLLSLNLALVMLISMFPAWALASGNESEVLPLTGEATACDAGAEDIALQPEHTVEDAAGDLPNPTVLYWEGDAMMWEGMYDDLTNLGSYEIRVYYSETGDPADICEVGNGIQWKPDGNQSPSLRETHVNETGTGYYYFRVRTWTDCGDGCYSATGAWDQLPLSPAHYYEAERLPTPTGLYWSGTRACWAEMNEPVNAEQVDVYVFYSENETDEPQRLPTCHFSNIANGGWSGGLYVWNTIWEHGTGYYYFTVKYHTADFTVVLDSEESELSPPYYYQKQILRIDGQEFDVEDELYGEGWYFCAYEDGTYYLHLYESYSGAPIELRVDTGIFLHGDVTVQGNDGESAITALGNLTIYADRWSTLSLIGGAGASAVTGEGTVVITADRTAVTLIGGEGATAVTTEGDVDIQAAWSTVTLTGGEGAPAIAAGGTVTTAPALYTGADAESAVPVTEYQGEHYARVSGAPGYEIGTKEFEEYLIVDGRVYDASEDNSGDGWRYERRNRELYILPTYSGKRIETNVRISIYLKADVQGEDGKAAIIVADGAAIHCYERGCEVIGGQGACAVEGTGDLRISADYGYYDYENEENGADLTLIGGEGAGAVTAGGTLSLNGDITAVGGGVRALNYSGLEIVSGRPLGISVGSCAEDAVSKRYLNLESADGVYSGEMYFSMAFVSYEVLLYGNGGVTSDGSESVSVTVTWYQASGSWLNPYRYASFTNGDKLQIGWSTSPDSDLEDIYSPTGYVKYYDVTSTFYARWEDETYAGIVLNDYFGEADSRFYNDERRVVPVRIGDTFTLPDIDYPTKKLVGWLGSDGVMYPGGTEITVDRSLSFYAEYREDLYIIIDGVKYDLGGSGYSFGDGWELYHSYMWTPTLYLNNYNGGPIITNTDLEISAYIGSRIVGDGRYGLCVEGDLKLWGDLTVIGAEGYEAIYATGTLSLYGELTATGGGKAALHAEEIAFRGGGNAYRLYLGKDAETATETTHEGEQDWFHYNGEEYIRIEEYDSLYQGWGVIGSICGTSWDTDFAMEQVNDNTWESGVLELKAGDEFKVRQNASWDMNFGVEYNGANIVVEEDGQYIVRLVWNGGTDGKVTLYLATGLRPDADGKLRYYQDNEPTEYTGLVEYTDGKTYYVYKGVVPMEYVGLYNHADGKIYYIYYGVAQKDYVGLYAHTNGVVYYIDNGTVSSTYTGLYAHSDGNSYYVYKGVIPTSYIGLCYHTDGKTYYIYKGVAVSSYTGLYNHTDGKVYYINEGVIDPAFVGLYTHTTGTTYYVYNGVVLTSYVGLYLHTDGNVYYVYNGVLVPSYVGFYFHTDGKLYYMSKGKIAVDYIGLAQHSDGKLYYVVNGVFDSTFNGTATDKNGNEYEVVNGIAQP